MHVIAENSVPYKVMWQELGHFSIYHINIAINQLFSVNIRSGALPGEGICRVFSRNFVVVGTWGDHDQLFIHLVLQLFPFHFSSFLIRKVIHAACRMFVKYIKV